MKYRVLRDCYWRRYYVKDSIVTFQDDVVVPAHFELVADNVVPEKEVYVPAEPMAMSQMVIKPQQTNGMAAGLGGEVIDNAKSVRRPKKPKE